MTTRRHDTASLTRVWVFLMLGIAVVLFLALRSTLTAPSGDGVPGPRSACETGQSTAQTAGHESWCDW